MENVVIKKKGRPAAIPNDDLLSLFIKYNKDIFVSDSSTELVSCSSSIWKDLENLVNGKLNSKSIYMCLSKNRNNIKERLLRKINKELDDSNVVQESDSETENNSTSTDENYSDDADNKISFKIILSYDEFIQVKPEVHEYKRDSYNKVYSTLKPNLWSSLLFKKIWSTSKIPCNYSFKKNKVGGKNSLNFIEIFGKCKDCGGNIKGWTSNEPTELTDWVVEIIADRPKLSKSKHVSKRFCRGIERKEISKQLQNEMPCNWRRKKVDEVIDFGDKIPPHIYDNHILRQAKNEYKSKTLGITNKCPIQSLVEHKYRIPYAGSIHTVSNDEAFVHYWSPYQIEVYKLAHKLSKGHCKVAIDATGGLVSKILRPVTGEKSHHFFLYEIVVYGLGIQESISQMVSEKQDLPTILYWFNKWQLSGVPSPNEVVTDMSRAILGAVSRAFCNGIGIKEYANLCLQYLLKESITIPKCFIRTDIAHFIKLQCRWKCFSGTNKRRLKEFYIRCSRLLIETKNIKDFKHILKSIFIVVYSETELQAELSLNYLLTLIEGHEYELDIIDYECEIDNTESNDELFFDQSDDFSPASTITNFLKNIEDSAKFSTPQKQQGSRINAYFLPDFGNELMRISQLFPLWTNLMVPVFNCPNTTASSAPVESDFNQLKTRILRNDCKPMTIDRFILTHLNALSGLMKIAYDRIKCHKEEKYNDEVHDYQSNKVIENKQLYSSSNKYSNDDEPTKLNEIHNVTKPNKLESQSLSGNTSLCFKSKRALFSDISSLESSDEDNFSDKSIKEEENWRGLGSTLKNQKKSFNKNKKSRPSKYLEPCPEIKKLLNSSRLRSSKKTYLLNGNKTTPLKSNNKMYLISNTCAFDSIVATICTAYFDNPGYKTFINNSADAFLTFCKTLALYGTNKEVYKQRLSLLEEKFCLEDCSKIPGLISYNAECNISDFLKKFGLKSITLNIECTKCTKKTQLEKHVITPNMKRLADCFEEMNVEVLQSLLYIGKSCEDEMCSGNQVTNYTLNEHLFIEVDLFSFYGPGTCDVSSIPVLLDLFNEKFSLVSIINFIGQPHSSKKDEIGHYTAHVKRTNGYWNLHDDLITKVKTYKCTENIIVQPHILVYIKQ